MEIMIIIWIVCAILGAIVTDRHAIGFVLGLLLGPIGVLIAAVMR